MNKTNKNGKQKPKNQKAFYKIQNLRYVDNWKLKLTLTYLEC